LYEESDEGNQLSQEYKDFVALGLTHNHFYKIRMAEVVFVYSKDGYIGNRLRRCLRKANLRFVGC
jgi:hypothetical protein